MAPPSLTGPARASVGPGEWTRHGRLRLRWPRLRPTWHRADWQARWPGTRFELAARRSRPGPTRRRNGIGSRQPASPGPASGSGCIAGQGSVTRDGPGAGSTRNSLPRRLRLCGVPGGQPRRPGISESSLTRTLAPERRKSESALRRVTSRSVTVPVTVFRQPSDVDWNGLGLGQCQRPGPTSGPRQHRDSPAPASESRASESVAGSVIARVATRVYACSLRLVRHHPSQPEWGPLA